LAGRLQCKYKRKAFGTAEIEHLLYAASGFVATSIGSGRAFFDLAVPDRAIAFPVKKGRASRGFLAFDRYNRTQRQVQLCLVEVLAHDVWGRALPDEEDRSDTPSSPSGLGG